MVEQVVDVDPDDVLRMLNAFYVLVRQDDELAPLFRAEVSDWDAHVDLMSAFWLKALADGPDTPIPAPPGLLYGMTRTSLARWHQLFTRATSAALTPQQAIRVRELSAEISDRQSGL